MVQKEGDKEVERDEKQNQKNMSYRSAEVIGKIKKMKCKEEREKERGPIGEKKREEGRKFSKKRELYIVRISVIRKRHNLVFSFYYPNDRIPKIYEDG